MGFEYSVSAEMARIASVCTLDSYSSEQVFLMLVLCVAAGFGLGTGISFGVGLVGKLVDFIVRRLRHKEVR